MVVVQSHAIKMFVLWLYAHPWPFGFGKTVTHWNCADKYNLIELSDLIGLGYDLSITQDGLKCWRMEIIFCGKHPLLLTRIQVSDRGPMGPLCFILFLYRHQINVCHIFQHVNLDIFGAFIYIMFTVWSLFFFNLKHSFSDKSLSGWKSLFMEMQLCDCYMYM